jgi:putative copper resistance protein D
VTADELVTAWAPSLYGVGLPALFAAAYGWGFVSARRRGLDAPAWRLALWLVTCAVAVWTFAGAPWALRTQSQWMDGIALGIASAVLPLGIAFGDPVGLAERLRGRPLRMLRGHIARAIMFPGVSSLISAVFLTIALTSGWWRPGGGTAPGPWAGLLGCAFVVGLLVNVPLLAEDLLPSWASPGVKTLVAFLDGLFDAVPGIVVMLAVNQQAGGALLAIAEAVGIPLMAGTLAQWVRADAVEAREVDARLDEEDVANVLDGEPQSSGLWWESDPRFADRFGRDQHPARDEGSPGLRR